MELAPSARHPTQEVLIVGIVGSSTNTFSKSWLYNEFTVFDGNGNENDSLRNSFSHIASNQDRFTKYDPFEWMRGIHKDDTCQEKVCVITIFFFYIHSTNKTHHECSEMKGF